MVFNQGSVKQANFMTKITKLSNYHKGKAYKYTISYCFAFTSSIQLGADTLTLRMEDVNDLSIPQYTQAALNQPNNTIFQQCHIHKYHHVIFHVLNSEQTCNLQIVNKTMQYSNYYLYAVNNSCIQSLDWTTAFQGLLVHNNEMLYKRYKHVALHEFTNL